MKIINTWKCGQIQRRVIGGQSGSIRPSRLAESALSSPRVGLILPSHRAGPKPLRRRPI